MSKAEVKEIKICSKIKCSLRLCKYHIYNKPLCKVSYKNLDGSKGCRRKQIIKPKREEDVIRERPVMCVSKNIIYSSAKEASIASDISLQSIRRCCRGQQGRAGGYRWEYIKEK